MAGKPCAQCLDLAPLRSIPPDHEADVRHRGDGPLHHMHQQLNVLDGHEPSEPPHGWTMGSHLGSTDAPQAFGRDGEPDHIHLPQRSDAKPLGDLARLLRTYHTDRARDSRQGPFDECQRRVHGSAEVTTQDVSVKSMYDDRHPGKPGRDSAESARLRSVRMDWIRPQAPHQTEEVKEGPDVIPREHRPGHPGHEADRIAGVQEIRHVAVIAFATTDCQVRAVSMVAKLSRKKESVNGRAAGSK